MKMDKKQLEIRNIGKFEVREDENSRHISGYACVWDKVSVDLGFRETIDKGAISQELLDNSDVYFNLNHDDNKILARWNKGVGSLKLSLDDTGLKFDFDAPKTDLGDTLLEYISRQDIQGCSFAFAVDYADETAEEWGRTEDGIVTRTIHKIGFLHDCSAVFNPAYPDTSISTRAADKYNSILSDMDKAKEKELQDKIKELEARNAELEKRAEEDKKEDKKDEPEKKEDPKEDHKDEPKNEPEKKEDPKDEPKDEPEEKKEDDKNKEDKRNINININMEKRSINLMKALREAANGNLQGANKAVSDAGAKEMRSAGFSVGAHDFVIPMETRAGEVTFTDAEDNVVDIDLQNIVAPLQAALVNNQLGIRTMTGLNSEVKIPRGKSVQAGWAKEIAKAAQVTPTFDSIVLRPYRISAYVDLSNEMLAMDSIGVQNFIVGQLQEAMAQKLEKSMWSAEAAVEGEHPAGLLNGLTAAQVADYKGLADFEAGLDEKNVDGDRKYLLSPKAKAAVRVMTRGGDHTQNVLEGNEIDGTPFVQTSNIEANEFVYGDFKDVVLAQFGGVKLTVDNISLAVNDTTRITITMYVDFTKVRPEALALGTVASTASTTDK